MHHYIAMGQKVEPVFHHAISNEDEPYLQRHFPDLHPEVVALIVNDMVPFKIEQSQWNTYTLWLEINNRWIPV